MQAHSYPIGSRVICKITWDGKTRQRNCRITGHLLPGSYQVQVWSNWTQTWYSDLIDVAEADITPMSILAGWGPRRHHPYVPDPP